MEALGGPIGTFSAGIGYFMSHWGLSEKTGITFTALTASAFLVTTLDSATRLGRYAVQELVEERSPALARNNHFCTAIVVGAAALALSGTWSTVWPLFGAANQMLGALALLAITEWLSRIGVKSTFTAIPMVIMFIVTIAALLVLIQTNFVSGNYFLAFSSIILFILCLFLILEARRSFTTSKDQDTTVKL